MIAENNPLNQIPTVDKKLNVETPADIATIYATVIDKFINRADVQNGRAIGYKLRGNSEPLEEDTPRMGIGQGFGTTGWCVSASAALLSDPIFQSIIKSRHARAKLVSIDVKEQWYGKCYNGTQNKWHTCILLQDSDYNFAVDITCAQFSSQFIGKYVWDWKTWESTFRSPYCKHVIFDNNNELISATPIENFADKSGYGSESFARVYDAMHDITNITDNERKFLTDYFLVNVNVLNDKLLKNNVSQLDFNYMEKVNDLLSHFPLMKIQNGVTVLRFLTHDDMKRWIKALLYNDNELKQNLFVSANIMESFIVAGGTLEEYNTSFDVPVFDNCNWYLVINFEQGFGVDVSFMDNREIYLPYGAKLNIDMESIINSGKKSGDNESLVKETNCVLMTVKSI